MIKVKEQRISLIQKLINPVEMISEFKLEYSKYLEFYQKEFGDFLVKFGVVHYAH